VEEEPEKEEMARERQCVKVQLSVCERVIIVECVVGVIIILKNKKVLEYEAHLCYNMMLYLPYSMILTSLVA